MPSIRYYNQTAPFWDFIARMEEQANNSTSDSNNNNNGHPWASAWGGGFPFERHFAHHGRPHPHGPGDQPTDNDETNKEPEKGKEADAGEGPSTHGPEGRPHPCHGQRSARGRCGGWRGGHGRGFGGHPRGPPNFAAGGPFAAWAEALQNQFFGGENETQDKGDDTFKPDVDVFDNTEAYVIHVSLAGAKKEDVGVSWDADKSELTIGGVLHRPGDEEFLKTLALDERKVGVFDRKVRLGSRANPAAVDVDAITARMEDGVLTIEVPKLDAGYVDIKKVDIE